MKQRLEIVSWPCRLLIILVLIYISTIFTSYSIYKVQRGTITKLQEAQAQKEQDTKQKIRTLLDSISPEILRRIEAGQKKILTTLGTADEVKLSNLSESADFSKYLSFKKITREDDFNDFEDPNIFIKGADYFYNWENGHYLYPKDALIK